MNRILTVEIVDRCIRAMKLRKAAGSDNIEAEHLVYSHPLLCSILTMLFNCMIMHGKVPMGFGFGIIVPVIKGNNLDNSVSENYRGITLSSGVSKLFEMCLLELYGDYLKSSELQFGFKKNLGCSHALYVLRSVVEYFNDKGSTVNLCALDLSKAFDKVNHYGLFIMLMRRSVPLEFLNILINWYDLCNAVVRWDNAVSRLFHPSCGVRQGGVLSPVLFAMYVDNIIINLLNSGHGCHIGSMFFGCIMYADDLVLLSGSLSDLQAMIDLCNGEISSLDMLINVKKSQIIRIGPRYSNICTCVTVNGMPIAFVDKLKYLGSVIRSSKCFKISIHDLRVKFYRAFNSLYARCHKLSEPVLQQLVNANCKPYLDYGTEAMFLSNSDLNSITYTFDMALCKIYKISRDCVKDIYAYTNQQDIKSSLIGKKRRFLQKCKMLCNSYIEFIYDMFGQYECAKIDTCT
jgi:hypothetical protein